MRRCALVMRRVRGRGRLLADPTGEVSVGGARRRFRATIAEGDVRDRIWKEGLRIYPGWSQYERRASHRDIAVFVLGDA